VEVERYADAAAFLERAGSFLGAREAEHNLLLGLCSRLARAPRLYGSDPYFATVLDGGRVVGAALRTPPHRLVLSEIDSDGACEALALDAAAVFGSLPGLLAPAGRAAGFVSPWKRATGARARRSREQRIHRCERVLPPPPTPGQARPFRDDDRELASRWLDAFVEEAVGESPVETGPAMLESRLSEPAGGLVLWDDGSPVSIAGFGGPTPNGIRVGPVYTPPEARRRGYASALVAELTRSLLGGGRRFCFLFTDLANPTANRIYRRLGYVPVTDVEEWSFDEPG